MLWELAILLAIAALSGMGVGGGGLLVVYLSFVSAEPQQVIQGKNLLFFLFASGTALLVHIRRRRLLGGVILLMACAGVLGSVLGSVLATVMKGTLLRKIFGVMLVSGGILSLRNKQGEAETIDRQKHR